MSVSQDCRDQVRLHQPMAIRVTLLSDVRDNKQIASNKMKERICVLVIGMKILIYNYRSDFLVKNQQRSIDYSTTRSPLTLITNLPQDLQVNF